MGSNDGRGGDIRESEVLRAWSLRTRNRSREAAARGSAGRGGTPHGKSTTYSLSAARKAYPQAFS